jgi:hypothetical protein
MAKNERSLRLPSQVRLAGELESDHSEHPGQSKTGSSAQQEATGRVERTERRNPQHLAPERESDSKPDRLKEDDEQNPSAQRDQRRVPRVTSGLENRGGEPPSDNRADDEPDESKRPRDESLLGAANSQQNSESEHDPVQPGHEPFRLVTS